MRRADPQTSQNQRDDEHSTETARCFSGNQSPDQQCGSETVENKILHSTAQDVRGQDKTTLPTAVIKTSLRMRERTVEVRQMHDIDKIVRRYCAVTEEGLKRPKKMKPWQRRLRKRIWFGTSTESWTYQCTKSLVMLKTPDNVAKSVTVTWNRSLIFFLMALRRLLFKHRQLKTSRKVMTQEVKVPVAGLHRVLRRSVREPRGAY